MRRLHTFLPRDYKLLVGKEIFFVKECPMKSSGVVKKVTRSEVDHESVTSYIEFEPSGEKSGYLHHRAWKDYAVLEEGEELASTPVINHDFETTIDLSGLKNIPLTSVRRIPEDITIILNSIAPWPEGATRAEVIACDADGEGGVDYQILYIKNIAFTDREITVHRISHSHLSPRESSHLKLNYPK